MSGSIPKRTLVTVKRRIREGEGLLAMTRRQANRNMPEKMEFREQTQQILYTNNAQLRVESSIGVCISSARVAELQ